MSTPFAQPTLFDEGDVSLLDQLFQEARRYTTSREYANLLRFIRRFPTLAPFNAFLIHTQRPGVTYVANARQWRERYERWIKPDANPLVILVPFGPVDFVYDIGDTDGKPVPQQAVDPFRANGKAPHGQWAQTIANCARDLIAVETHSMPAQSAGYICRAASGETVGLMKRGKDGKPEVTVVKARYRLVFNSQFELPARYATVAHELAHLYCGHLGTPDERWWPDRRGLPLETREFEAESVTYIVCTHLGIDNPSAAYLAGYMRKHNEIPSISIEAILKAAGEIERMGRGRLGLRKYDRIESYSGAGDSRSTTNAGSRRDGLVTSE